MNRLRSCCYYKTKASIKLKNQTIPKGAILKFVRFTTPFSYPVFDWVEYLGIKKDVRFVLFDLEALEHIKPFERNRILTAMMKFGGLMTQKTTCAFHKLSQDRTFILFLLLLIIQLILWELSGAAKLDWIPDALGTLFATGVATYYILIDKTIKPWGLKLLVVGLFLLLGCMHAILGVMKWQVLHPSIPPVQNYIQG